MYQALNGGTNFFGLPLTIRIKGYVTRSSGTCDRHENFPERVPSRVAQGKRTGFRRRFYFAEAADADHNCFNSSYVKKIRDASPLSSRYPNPSTRENHRSSGRGSPSKTAALCSSTTDLGPRLAMNMPPGSCLAGDNGSGTFSSSCRMSKSFGMNYMGGLKKPNGTA